MHSITILEVEAEQPAGSVGDQPAFRCIFDAGWGPAAARLVPSGKSAAALAGERVQARPGYRSIDGLQVLPEGNERSSLLPLEEQGCFQAEGQVGSLVWLDDEGESLVVEVLVGGWTFAFEANAAESGEVEDLAYGGWVRFVIRDLTWYILADG